MTELDRYRSLFPNFQEEKENHRNMKALPKIISLLNCTSGNWLPKCSWVSVAFAPEGGVLFA